MLTFTHDVVFVFRQHRAPAPGTTVLAQIHCAVNCSTKRVANRRELTYKMKQNTALSNVLENVLNPHTHAHRTVAQKHKYGDLRAISLHSTATATATTTDDSSTSRVRVRLTVVRAAAARGCACARVRSRVRKRSAIPLSRHGRGCNTRAFSGSCARRRENQ